MEKENILGILNEVLDKTDIELLKTIFAEKDELRKEFASSIKRIHDKIQAKKDVEKHLRSDPTSFPFNFGC